LGWAEQACCHVRQVSFEPRSKLGREISASPMTTIGGDSHYNCELGTGSGRTAYDYLSGYYEPITVSEKIVGACVTATETSMVFLYSSAGFIPIDDPLTSGAATIAGG